MFRLFLLVALTFVLVDKTLSQDAKTERGVVTALRLGTEIPSSSRCLNRRTPWRNAGNGHLKYLRTLGLYCPYPRAMTYFRLQYRYVSSSRQRQIRYIYRCCQPKRQVYLRVYHTLYKPYSNGKVYHLKHHSVTCSNGIIAGFRLKTQGSQFRYSYYCRNMATTSCYSKQTPLSNFFTGHVNRLRFHFVRCNDITRHFLKSFRLQHIGSKIRYRYQCCRA